LGAKGEKQEAAAAANPATILRRITVKRAKDDLELDNLRGMKRVEGRTPPHRYQSKRGVRGRSRRKKNGDQFSETALDLFFGSLDERLFPAALRGEPDAREDWSDFWASRASSAASVIRRFIEETKSATGRAIDPEADAAELFELEREIAAKLRPGDKRALRVFIGKLDVEVEDLAEALWQTHADAWFALASMPSVRECVANLGGNASSDPRGGLPPKEPRAQDRPSVGRARTAPKAAAPGPMALALKLRT
jgi:hypothetical protein